MQPASGRALVPAGPEPRRLAAFVYADMVGYTRLIGRDDAGTYTRLARLRHSLIYPALERYGGKVDNTAGDSLLMEFSSVLSAVRFAVEVQTRIPEFDGDDPPDHRIRFRMGVNVGDAIPDGANMHGASVNIAARLESVCPPGGVCVSAGVRDHVQERLGLRLESMGRLDLKNVDWPIEAFCIRLGDIPVPRIQAHPRRRWWMIGVALALICLAAAGAGWRWRLSSPAPERPSPAAAGVPPLSIAVLPFTNLSNDRDQDYLADGIAEDLTTDLSQLEGAFVVARESAFTYRGKSVDIREVGRELGVRYVLEGSVRKLGDQVRINAQLISAHDGLHVWAERVDEPLRELEAGQDSTVQRIGSALNVRLDEAKQKVGRTAADPAAFELVLRAKAILNEPKSEARDTIAAGYFEQALRLDPSSVPAMAGVAAMLVRADRWIGRAAGLIARAELASANSPDVLGARYRLLLRQQRFEDATATLRKLLEIDSSAAGIAAELDLCPRCWGRPEEAATLLERVAHLNPLSPNREVIYVTLGRTLILLGLDAEAIQWLEPALHILRGQPPVSKFRAREPGDMLLEFAKADLAAAYALSGRMDDAHTTLASVLSSERMQDFTVRAVLNSIPSYYDSEQQQQERRIAEGLRLAGLQDHLDEQADYGIPSTSYLRASERTWEPTPVSVPGATTIRTEEVQRLLEAKPLMLTTAISNPTIPGAIFVDLPNSGSITDEWQAALGRLVSEVTDGDKQRPIVTFAYSINRWQSRNLALRLVALGYRNVYWYRGGWEAWDAHGLPKAPLDLQLMPRQ